MLELLWVEISVLWVRKLLYIINTYFGYTLLAGKGGARGRLQNTDIRNYPKSGYFGLSKRIIVFFRFRVNQPPSLGGKCVSFVYIPYGLAVKNLLFCPLKSFIYKILRQNIEMIFSTKVIL